MHGIKEREGEAGVTKYSIHQECIDLHAWATFLLVLLQTVIFAIFYN